MLRVWVLVSFKILCEKLCLGIGFAFDIKKNSNVSSASSLYQGVYCKWLMLGVAL